MAKGMQVRAVRCRVVTPTHASLKVCQVVAGERAQTVRDEHRFVSVAHRLNSGSEDPTHEEYHSGTERPVSGD